MASPLAPSTPCRYLLDTARQTPHAPALVTDEEAIDYATLCRRVERVSVLLRGAVDPGSRIALLMDNSANYATLYWGILLAGATSVELNPTLPAAELERQMRAADAQLYIADEAHAAHLEALGPTARSEPLAVAAGPHPGSGHISAHALAEAIADTSRGAATTFSGSLCAPQDLASIVFTSGTTGEVKGVELTHHNLAWTTEAIGASFAMRRAAGDEVLSAVLPLYYTYGKSALHLAAWLASPIVFSESFPSPRNLVRLFARAGVTHVALVPHQCRALLERDDFCADVLPRIARVTVAGGALDASTRAAMQQRFPGRLFVMYGLTEASTRVSCLPDAGGHHDTSCGHPLPGVTIRIDHGAEAPHAGGGVGEILVRGDNVMRGYFRDPQASHRVLADGWLHTGDVGHLDTNGALHVTGRLKDIIKVMGESVAASAVEEAIRAIAEVSDAAVIGVADPRMGEAIHAFVCLHPGREISPEQVRQHCNRVLGRVRTPSTVSVVDALPRTASGKVRKHLLVAPR